MKYKILSEETVKNLIEFLDEIQFDAAKESSKDSIHKINFCNWMINELLNSFDAYIKDENDKKRKIKKRQDYVDETFMDWNLPEMTDEEYERLVDQFDSFLRSWEKEYLKNNPEKKITKRVKKDKKSKKEEYKPHVDDIMEWCSLEEVEEFLKDDPELTDNERFELYYDERERRKPKQKGLTYNQLLKKAGIKPSDGDKNEKDNK